MRRRICWHVRGKHIVLVLAGVLVDAIVREENLYKGQDAPLVLLDELVESNAVDARRPIRVDAPWTASATPKRDGVGRFDNWL